MAKLSTLRATSTALLLVASIGSAQATVSYQYDDLGRVISITYDNGTRVLYSYDAAGNRTQHTIDATPNNPPVAVNDSKSLNTAVGASDTILPLVNDSDPNGDLITIQSVAPPLYGTATINGGASMITYTYTASVALPVTDTFTYTISDGRGGTATATISVQLFVGNLPPVANPDFASVLDALTVSLDPRFNDTDPEANPLIVTAVSNGANGTVTILNGGTAVEYVRTSQFPVPGPGGGVSDTFSYTISDGQGGTASSDVTVTLEMSAECGGAGQPACP
jgi:YD repeat-containing protein